MRYSDAEKETSSARRTISRTRQITFVALAAAILCILGPVSIPLPFSPVPISLGLFGIYISVYLLGMKWGTVACLIYILLGLAGLPVFVGFTGGAEKLFGPTGGYIIGYLFAAYLSGFFIDNFEQNRLLHFAGMLLGTAVCYAFGTLLLAHQASMSFSAALLAGVIPFIPGDLAKIVLALVIGPKLRSAVRRIR